MAMPPPPKVSQTANSGGTFGGNGPVINSYGSKYGPGEYERSALSLDNPLIMLALAAAVVVAVVALRKG